MNFFRRINKRTLLLWGLLLSLSLLCAQEARLHVHNLDHGNNDHHSHIHAIDETGDHAHLSKAHFAHDTPPDDHDHDVISEVDISPDGVLKNTNNDIFALALVVFVFPLVMFVSSRQLVQRRRESKPIRYGYFLLSPPLRAPPPY